FGAADRTGAPFRSPPPARANLPDNPLKAVGWRVTMHSRLRNPATILPGATPGAQALLKAAREGGVPSTTLELAHLRASQINGCSFCVDSGARSLKKAGETDERIFAVAAWRDVPYFTDAERAALALAEAVTRLSDRSDPVPDGIW